MHLLAHLYIYLKHLCVIFVYNTRVKKSIQICRGLPLFKAFCRGYYIVSTLDNNKMWRHSQLPIAWNTSKDGDVAKITQIPSVLRDADVFTKTKPLLAPTSVDKDTIAYTDLEHGKKLNNVEFKATGKTIVQDDSLNLDEHTRIAAEESFLNGLFFGSQEPFNMRFNGNGLNYLSNEERESLKKGFLELSNRRNFRNLGPVLQRRVIENRASDENEDGAKNVTLPEFIFFH